MQLWLNDALDLLDGPYLAEVGTEWGDWQAITTSKESLFLDGSVVSGDSTGNRAINLRVRVEDRWSRPALIGACEALLGEANKAAGTLRFVPDEGPSVVYEVYRAQPSRVDDQSEAWPRRTYQLAFPTEPFTRSAERVMPSAFAPGVTIERFDDGTFTGLALGTPTYATVNTVSQFMIPTTALDAPLDLSAETLTGGDMEPDTNCGPMTVGTYNEHKNDDTVVSGHRYEFDALADGDVIFRTIATWPVSGDVVSACGGFLHESGSGWMVGVEFLDAAGGSLGTTWGVDTGTSHPTGTVSTTASVFVSWVTAVAPPGAVSYRARYRLTDCTAGTTYYAATAGHATAQSSVGVPDRGVMVSGHRGEALQTNAQPTNATYADVAGQVGISVYGRPAAPLDLTAQEQVSLRLQVRYAESTGEPGRYLSLRLYDAAGNFSRWRLSTDGMVVSTVWQRLAFALDTPPDATGPGGPADLSQVAGWVVDENQFMGSIDSLVAGPFYTATTSEYGTVFDLADIKGSARSPVQLAVSGPLAMSDWLAAVAPVGRPPLLSADTAVAAVAAPAAYDGVYRVLASIVPAAAVASPTCVVAQLVDGVQVATDTLEGTQTDGNAYVDFGAVPLPLVGVPAEATVSYTFTLTPATAAWSDVLVLDVDAPFAWVPHLDTAATRAWIDEPEAAAQMGRVWVGDNADRTDARSPSDPPDLSRPFSVKSPGVSLLIYSTAGAPDITLSYYPRWLVEPTQ